MGEPLSEPHAKDPLLTSTTGENTAIGARKHVLFLLIVLVCFSPLLQPYLINPDIVPYYSTSALFLLLAGAILFQATTVRITVGAFGVLFPLLLLSFFQQALHPTPMLWLLYSAMVLFLLTAGSAPASPIRSFLPYAYLCAAGLWSLLGLYVWAGGTDGRAIHFGAWALSTIAQAKPNGPFTNGNVMAILDACAWLIATRLAVRSRKLLWWGIAWWFLFCLVVSHAWGAWIAWAPVFLWLLSFTYRRQRKAFVALWGSLLLALAMGQAFTDFVLRQEGDILRAKQEHGIEERKVIWESSLRAWLDHPITGVGIGKLAAHYLDHQAQTLAEYPSPHAKKIEQNAVDSAHNSLLHLLAEAGLAGLLLWLGTTFLLVRLAWIYRGRIHSPRWTFLGCAWLLWIQGLGNITMSRAYPVLLFALFLSLAYAPILRVQARPEKGRGILSRTWKVPTRARKLLGITCLFLAIALGWQAAVTTRHWLDFERVLFSPEARNMPPRERARITAELIEDPSIAPHLVSSLIGLRLLAPETRTEAMKLEPYLDRALQSLQTILLLEQRFYMYVLQQRWDKACALAHTLRSMEKERSNWRSYARSCQGLPPDEGFRFSIAQGAMQKPE